MTLNPQFASQSSRKLPLGFGYIFGAGDNDLSTVAVDGSQYKRFILGEGEWDGVEMANAYQLSATANQAAPVAAGAANTLATGPHMFSQPVLNADTLSPLNPAAAGQTFSEYLHFHGGAYTPIGTAIPTPDPITGIIPPNTSESEGPDQGYDRWFLNFPTVMPAQSLSGVAHSIWGAPSPATAYQMWLAWPPPQGPQSYSSFLNSIYQGPTITGTAVYRAMRCRIFDAYGNIIGYKFTCNPAWHKVEAILRRKIRPEQPPLAGLTPEEIACFNWDAIATLAARNDYLLPNGKPRFVGNYLFAGDNTLANMMETMCRADRSFQRVDGNQIVLQGDDPRASVFIASRKHLVDGTLSLNKKDVSKAPNVFVPTYRDLDIPAVSKVISGVSYGGFYLSGRHIAGFRALTASTPSPFGPGCFLRYGGCSDPSWDGTYAMFIANGDPYPIGTDFPNTTYMQMDTPDGTPIENVTGGYLGADDARFSQRAPVGVQHRSAQKMVAAQAPGLGVQPKVIKVLYDCGNSTFDQTNRLMKFEMARQLGTDTGAGWMAPIAGTLSLYLESVDCNGVQLPQVAKAHNIITLDDWLFPEGPGDYEIEEVAFTTAQGDQLGRVDLTVRAETPDAGYTDVSDAPGDYYFSVPNSSLALTGFASPGNPPAWVLQSTLTLVGGETLAIASIASSRRTEPHGATVYLLTVTLAAAGTVYSGQPFTIAGNTFGAFNADWTVAEQTGPTTFTIGVPDGLAGAVGFTNSGTGGTATFTPAGGTYTIAIPDLSIQLMGRVAPTAYPYFLVAGVPLNTQVCLYVDDPTSLPGGSGIPSYGWVAGSALVAPPPGRILVYTGTFT